MTPEKFAQLASQNFNRIPVTREVLADLETPLSVYLKLALGANSYLFESVQGGEKWGRYSLIGLQTSTVLKVFGNRLEIIRDGKPMVNRTTSDPLAEVERFRQLFSMPNLPELPRFTGGLVGYFGYDTVRFVEPRLAKSTPPDELDAPDILLLASDEVAIFDNLSGTIMLVVHVDAAEAKALEKAEARLDELEALLAKPTPVLPPMNLKADGLSEEAFVSSFGKQDYMAAVDKIKDYVLAGDVMQVVPSQRLSAPFTAEPINLYRALRRLNPSPYMYFLDLDGIHIVGSSPEVLARLEDGQVTVRPIAGTRRRGQTEEEDQALEREMLADPKEIAEHLMLIDLGRNDVGRISQTGTVEVTEKMVVERYSHVMHITSNVVGTVNEGMGALEVLKATLPAGTLSGAPKIRAMEIIDELEPVKRGIYGGAVGYIGWSGNMDTAIAIRTAVIKDGQLHVQAGAGIVADSVPESEWEETMNKARAIMRAAAMVCNTSGEESQ
ncbi:anthranilate synthase component I [Porticoccaceae bacterium]|jgi:anthranilate synthase component 1|nr:anthranilate synthase component I [Porticoccaceae bacterium]MDB4108997.1 anthranilate synthase component I [Porticoccaceae bacterium]MDB9843147.1 anthranilate synthase component I [Porticoccaceae bacterium]MDC1477227.1 anthranilate synthase component I [Porticoccaceae bacterium]CAI8374156.1 MAG: Anthranilate synthase component 1 [SAR92 bacterium MED-G29]|tara:strand:- start:8107 stop:9597 length:1491 start_codon:yes stop_codon:yes gene_type:complete